MRLSERLFLAVPNALFRMSSDWDDRPATCDPYAVCPELKLLEDNFAVIQSEYRAATKNIETAPRYHEVDPGRSHVSLPDDTRAWRTFFLEAMGRKFAENRTKLPRTAQLIDRIPEVFQAFVSRLDPHKSIKPHAGPYHGYLRYHLPLEVPSDGPLYMLVEDSKLVWVEGRGFMFDDTFQHSVVNSSDHPRSVLIVDVCRPMRVLGRGASRSTTFVLRHTYARWMERRMHEQPWSV